MDEKKTQEKTCHSNLTQRRNCVYYHADTGRCTMDPPRSTWQGKTGPEQTKPR